MFRPSLCPSSGDRLNRTASGVSLKTRFQAHIIYEKPNSPQSAYAQHILHNRHEYGTLTETMTLLKPLQHENMLLPFEQFHIQSLHQAGKLIPEQCPNDSNALFQLDFTNPHHTRHETEPVNQHPANRTHNPQLHNRPATWKPQVCTSSFQCMYLSITSTSIQSHPTNGIPDPQTKLYTTKKPTKNTHTQPPRHSSHLITNLDNTRHLRLRTQIPHKLTNNFLHFYSTKYHRQQPPYNTPELLMMGIVLPETFWASNNICNKNLCCIYLAFYFHILTKMRGQNHIKLIGYKVDVWNKRKLEILPIP